ncbi:MAG: AMP-binding protein [Exilibacterium sp.]
MDTIITKLYEQVHKTPQESVLFDQSTEITYAILLDKIHHVRDKLSHQGVQPSDKIAICADNSTEFVIAVFAVMDLGCIFVPLSPHDPQARIVSILNKLCPAVTLIQKRAPYFQDFHPMVLSDLLADDVDEMMVNRPRYRAPLPRKSSDLAYIILQRRSRSRSRGIYRFFIIQSSAGNFTLPFRWLFQ